MIGLFSWRLSFVFFILNASSFLVEAQSITLPGIPSGGFFCNFCVVLGALDELENQNCTGVIVAFNREHCYFDAQRGENWWKYYFEESQWGDGKNDEIPSQGSLSNYARWVLPKSRVHFLIQKYISIKPEIVAKVDSFCAKHFQNHYIVGVHYRGTDKKCEATSCSYEKMFMYMDEIREKHPDCKFFIATDEELFLKRASKRYHNAVISCDHLRSSGDRPVHLVEGNSNYIKGEEALIDCLLLSKCSALIRMCSNLSAAALFFNPDLDVVTVTQSFDNFKE